VTTPFAGINRFCHRAFHNPETSHTLVAIETLASAMHASRLSDYRDLYLGTIRAAEIIYFHQNALLDTKRVEQACVML